jgi:hypothetical protein
MSGKYRPTHSPPSRNLRLHKPEREAVALVANLGPIEIQLLWLRIASFVKAEAGGRRCIFMPK